MCSSSTLWCDVEITSHVATLRPEGLSEVSGRQSLPSSSSVVGKERLRQCVPAWPLGCGSERHVARLVFPLGSLGPPLRLHGGAVWVPEPTGDVRLWGPEAWKSDMSEPFFGRRPGGAREKGRLAESRGFLSLAGAGRGALMPAFPPSTLCAQPR